MRVFVLEHVGEWLPGYSVYIGNEEPTPEQIKEHLKKLFPNKDPNRLWANPVQELKPGMNTVWDGDY